MSYVAGDRMISWPWFRESLPCVPPATPRTLPLYPAGPLCLKGICHSIIRRDPLFCVEWDVKPYPVQFSQDSDQRRIKIMGEV